MLLRANDGSSEGWGLSEAEVLGLLSGEYQPKDEVERVCIEFVRTASDTPGAVPDALLARLREHLTPPQIVELACVVGFWKFYNTVHDSLHIPVESSLLRDTGYVEL